MKRLIILAVIAVIGVVAAVLYNLYPPEPVQVMATIGEDGMLTLVQNNISDVQQEQVIQTEDIAFSLPADFYSENIEVELTSKDGTDIFFTTDGSDPEAVPSQRYTQPIQINAGNDVIATTIKAITVKDSVQSKIFTRSYITGTDVDTRFDDDTLVFVLSTDPYNLYDYEYGIAVPGKIYDDYVRDHAGQEIPYNAPGNYYMSGREAERDMYVEVFESDGDYVISQAAGARVVGGYSRVVDQKSFKLIARKEYDPENGKFKYPFFDDATTYDGTPISEYDRIVLRNGANDREFAGVRDELSQQLARDYGYPCTQHTTPAAVFLNGEYYGYSWLHENYNEDYLATQFGGNKEQYALVSNTEIPEEGSTEQALEDYLRMTEYYDKDLTDDKIFAEFCELVDVENLMQYYCMQIFISNKDWPGNNYKAFRYYPAEGEEITSKFMDGRWRYLFFDAEYGWGLYGEGFRLTTLSDLLDGSHMSGESKALIALLKRPDMQQLYANIMSDLTSYAFETEHILEVLDDLCEMSDDEQFYALERGKTSTWAHRGTFADSREQIRDFAKNRKLFVMADMRENLRTLVDPATYKVTVYGSSGAATYLSTQKAEGGTLTGRYYYDCSVKLCADVYDGYEFIKWEINGKEYTEPELMLDETFAEDLKITAKLYVNKLEVTDQPLRVIEICTDSNAGWIKLHNPNSESVTTAGLTLTDDPLVPARWSVPVISLKPGESITIVMKANKTSDALMKYQTNFNLKQRETLILADADANILQSIEIPYMDEGRTYVLGANGRFSVK